MITITKMFLPTLSLLFLISSAFSKMPPMSLPAQSPEINKIPEGPTIKGYQDKILIRDNFFKYIQQIARFYFCYLPSENKSIVEFANAIKYLVNQESLAYKPSWNNMHGIFLREDEARMIQLWNASPKANSDRKQIRLDFERTLIDLPITLKMLQEIFEENEADYKSDFDYKKLIEKLYGYIDLMREMIGYLPPSPRLFSNVLDQTEPRTVTIHISVCL
jgi:hypothetical protein